MRIVHVTAGAGGRICGSCLHDNTLVRALVARGSDAILVPAYVPTTTDEENIAEQRIVMGGVNDWLQEHVPLFRHTPAWIDWLLDSRRLLEWLSSRNGATRPADLGPLTISTLRGMQGNQRKEVAKLTRWLACDVRPDVVHLSNALLLGLARPIREATGARIVCSLSGEDIFIDQIPAVSVIPHGVDLAEFPPEPPDLVARRRGRGNRLVVGFLARACPEKGLDQLIRALPLLAARHQVEILAAGATVDAERDYIAQCHAVARDLGVADRFRWLGQIDRSGKLDLLASVDVFLMPTTHAEAKGLPVIEAMAAGVPIGASNHGAFPELLDDERAGLLHTPGDPADLASKIAAILDDESLASRLGRHGHALARERHTAHQMAAAHEALYERVF